MLRETGALILLFGFACIPTFGREVALCILIVMVFGRPMTTFKSLVAGTTVTLIAITFTRGSGAASFLLLVLKWLLLFAACARSLVAQGVPTKTYGRLIYYWGLISGVLVINALFVSAFPAISGFKAVSFSLGLLCIIRLAMLTADRNNEMLLFVSEMGTAVVILCIPVLPLDVGWAQLNGYYFNGIFYHPQGLGVFLVITGAASFMAAYKMPNLRRILIVCGLAQWSMIYFTKCRTALVAIVLGGIIYFIENLVRGGKSSRIRLVSVSATAFIVTGLLLATIAFPGIREAFTEYLRKGDVQHYYIPEDRSDVLRSLPRGKQIIDDLDLMEEHPLLGFGFGVDKSSEQYVEANEDKLGGIPLSAPVEQGFLPLATIAQIGIVGSFFMLLLLLSMYRFARQDSAEDAALFVTVLGVNFGEMIIYSLGSPGLIVWVALMLFTFSGTASRQYSGVLSR
jgi:hypothetical protein